MSEGESSTSAFRWFHIQKMKQLTVFIFYLHVPNFVGKKKINPLHQKKDCLLNVFLVGCSVLWKDKQFLF